MNEQRKSTKASQILKEVMHCFGYDNVTEFSNKIGSSYMKVYYTYNGTNSSISDELADRIVETFPNVNREYLSTGVGSITIDGEGSSTIQQQDVQPEDMVKLVERFSEMFDRLLTMQERLVERENNIIELEQRLMSAIEKLENK